MQFNIKNYGAVGDGVANDLGAINQAFKAAKVAGGTVFIPTGKYNLVGDGLRLSSNVSYLGEGNESVLFRADGTTIFTSWKDKVDNVRVKNLRLESTSTTPNEYKPLFDSLDSTFNNLTIDTCWFSSRSNCNHVSLVMNDSPLVSTNITVTNCTFETCGRINLEIFTNKYKNKIMIEGLTITNNKFFSSGMMNLSAVTPAKNMVVRGNEFVCDCPNVYAVGFESTPWMINAIFDQNTVSGNFGTGAISNINVVGNDIKAFGEPPPFSYQITNNSFKDVKATDSALFVKGLINGTVSGNTFQVTNSIKLDNCTACTFSKNQVNSQANQAVIIRTTNGVTLSDNTLSTKDSPNQTAIVTASTPNNVLLKDNVLIKGAGGTYLSGNYTDQNNSKYDNIDPPAPAPARKIQITFQTVDGKPVTFQSGQTLTVYI